MTVELDDRDKETLEDITRRLDATSHVEAIRRSIQLMQALHQLRDGGKAEVWVHRAGRDPVQLIIVY